MKCLFLDPSTEGPKRIEKHARNVMTETISEKNKDDHIFCCAEIHVLAKMLGQKLGLLSMDSKQHVWNRTATVPSFLVSSRQGVLA